MNSSYSILAAIIGLFLLFLYSSWIYISAKYVWKKEEISSEPKKKIRWKNIVDKKNEELGWFDLGNHIIILGVILFAIFIVKNT
jgi:hypothetical protein|tara:strand:- start:2691 stop:2942 length:252 start_codon:yes stop_codon:yes gene_type:complete